MCVITVRGLPVPNFIGQDGFTYYYASRETVDIFNNLVAELKNITHQTPKIQIPPEKVDVFFPFDLIANDNGKVVVLVEALFINDTRTPQVLIRFAKNIAGVMASFLKRNLPQKQRIDVYICPYNRQENPCVKAKVKS
jgi:hypothetical protein